MSILRISDDAHALLRDLSRLRGVSMRIILDDALEQYRRVSFLEEANAAYGRLRKNKKAWKQEQEERKAWEATLSDDRA